MGRFIDGSQTSTVLANNPANCFSASCTFVFSSTEVMAAIRLDIVGRSCEKSNADCTCQSILLNSCCVLTGSFS